ncbi:hypothetical protein AB4Z55_21920 [Gordonia sp. ABKF26]
MLRAAGVSIKRSSIGDRVVIDGRDVFVSEGVDLGADVFIDATAPVYLGAGVRVGPGARILTSVDRAGDAVVTTGDDPAKPVLIGAGAQIGARAVILPGVTIGERTVIRDDSEVRENCRPDATYGGIPARRLDDL